MTPALSTVSSSTWRQAVRVVYKDVARGIGASLHHSLALVGLGVLVLGLAALKPEWRASWKEQVSGWLQGPTADSDEALAEASMASVAAQIEFRSETSSAADAPAGATGERAQAGADDDGVSPVERATATDPAHLDKQQAAVASWLSRRYRVAPEPVSRIVQEAWQLGQRTKLDPTLILAIMAIESNFNPFAQSKVGAQGLMQVMTQLHDKKYQAFGGTHAAFDPVTNIRVGVQVLKDCLRLAGDITTALQYYSGAARLPNDQGYANKVLSEQNHLKNVAAGRAVAVLAPVNSTPLPVRPPGASESNAKAPAPSPDDSPAALLKAEPPAGGVAVGTEPDATLAAASPRPDARPEAAQQPAEAATSAAPSELPASTAVHQEPVEHPGEPSSKI